MIKLFNSIRGKLFVSFLLTILVLISQNFIFTYLTKKLIIEKTNVFFEENIIQLGRRIDLQIHNGEAIAERMAKYQINRNYLKDLKYNRIVYNIAKYKIVRNTFGQIDPSIIENLYIFPTNNKPINCFYNEAKVEIDSFSAKLINDFSTESRDDIFWQVTKHDPYEISAYAYIVDQNELLGLLQISFNESLLHSVFERSNIEKDGNYFLLSPDQSVLYSNKANSLGLLFRDNVNGESSSEKSMYVTYALETIPWELVGSIPMSSLYKELNEYNAVLISFLVIIIFILSILLLLFASSILRPLHDVLKGMKHIQDGNLDVTLQTTGDNEFSAIIDNFNFMAYRIKMLLNTIQIQNQNQRKAELSTLQGKLNPHFLYNTLDMIYWKLIINEQEDIGEVIVDLSSILRYSISNENELVTLREDMAHTLSYLKIQQLHFYDNLAYNVQIDEELFECKIPKLSIQPLIENSIKYNNNAQTKLMISINGYFLNEFIVLEVIDNGIGISQAQYEQIIKKLDHYEQENGLGLLLVHRRIKYEYGDDCGLTLCRNEEKGLKIIVKLKNTSAVDIHAIDAAPGGG